MSQSLDQFSHPSRGAGPCLLAEPAPLLLPASSVRPPIALAAETTVVVVGAIAAVRLLHVHRPAGLHWLLIPCTLVAAALIPAWIARRDFPRIGLRAAPIRLALQTVALACLCVLPPVYLGLWLLTSSGLPVPLRPIPARQEDWVTWLLYQFLYVATTEEVFFRGYLQANVARAMEYWNNGKVEYGSAGSRDQCPLHPSFHPSIIPILLSAGAFALAHVVVQGQIVSALTFLPGLLMAWLFVRTRSLLAPILFHGLANVSYGIMAATLT